MTFHFGGRERRRCLEVLGLHDPVTEEEVKKAYRAAALKFHPDKNPNPDAKEKFQEANTAYNFLLKGDSYLEHALHDQDDFGLNAILRYLFPWLFEERPREGYNRQAASGGNYSHFGGDSPFSHVYEGRRYHQGTWYNSRHFDPGPAHRPTGASHRHSHGRQQYSFYYDDDDDDDDDEDSGRGGGQAGSRAETGGRGSVPQHGQFFQEQADRRGAKKRNRQARRAQRLVEDQAGREQSNSRAGHRQGAAATDAHTRPMSQTRREGTSRPSSTSPRSPSATRESRPEEQIPKKSKKQLQAEQRQREKEQAQLRLELEEMERVKKEKIEKKRAAEEEKERIERAQREEEERREQEEERKREEERRNQREMDEKKRRERMEEEERVRKLMEEFDKSDFMDERGEFKSTDPDLVNVIRRGDMNSLGNARSSEHEEPVDSIHGFNTADLIRLQSEGGNSRQAAETSPGNGPGYDQRSPGYDQRSPGYDRHDGRDRPTRLGGDAGGTAGQNSWQKNHFRPEGENSEGRGRGYIQGQRPRFPGPSRKFQNQRGVAGQPVLFSHPPPPPFPRAMTPLLHTPPPGYPPAVWATPPPPVWAGPPPAHHYPPQGFPGPRLPSFDFSHTPPPAQRAGHW